MSYQNLIFTNHANEKIKERQLVKNEVLEAFSRPDSKYNGKKSGTTELKKQFSGYSLTLIVKQNETKEWVLLSCWRDPPLFGTKDYQRKKNWEDYKKAGFWGKIWIGIKQQLGF